MHSFCSDGFWSPTEVVLMAKKAGLKQISITDHNTISGLPEAALQAKVAGIDFVDGVEINAQTNFNNEIFQNHILAYRFEKKKIMPLLRNLIYVNNKLFKKTIKNLKNIIKTNKLVVLNKRHPTIAFKKNIEIGKIDEFNILKDEFKRIYSRKITRNDVKKLLEQRIFPQEVVARFIKNNLLQDSKSIVELEPRFWAKKIIFKNLPDIFEVVNEKEYHLDHKSVLDTIAAASGISILAHPFLDYSNYSKAKQKKYILFLDKLLQNGLNGFEAYYYEGQGFSKKYQQDFNKKTAKLCMKNRLLMTFGSDCHGPKRNDPSKIFVGMFGSENIVKLG